MSSIPLYRVAFIIEHCRQLTGFDDPAQGRKTCGVKAAPRAAFGTLP
jgi:hypothetical protein